MAYPTDGQSHANGLKGEKLIEYFFEWRKGRCFGLDEQYGEFIRIDSFGGTHNKNDSVAVYTGIELGISTKNHTNGTFDWMNMSRDIKKRFPKLSALKEKYNHKFKGLPRCEETIAKYRGIFNKESQKALLGLSSEGIREIMQTAMGGTQKQFVAVIDHPADSSERFKGFFGRHHPEYKVLDSKDCELFLMQSRGAKTSAQVWARNSITGEEHSTNLRARLVLNNGASIWLGGKEWIKNYNPDKKNNNTSDLCFKIQQDNVDGLLEGLRENDHLLTESEIV